MIYIQPRHPKMENRPNPRFPKEENGYWCYYFSKNSSDDYIDLQQRLTGSVIVDPVENMFPYDPTINVKYMVEMGSAAAEYLQWILPHRTNAMAEVMGVPIQSLICYLIDAAPNWHAKLNAERFAVMQDTVEDMMSFYGTSKRELYEKIMDFYGSDFVWQEFSYTVEQNRRFSSVWNRPEIPKFQKSVSLEAWRSVVWKSELQLYGLVSAFFPDAERRYSPKWLGRQHLDIYSPKSKIAFEYQGKQHYEADDFFGGEIGLIKRQYMDKRKRMLCKKNGTCLIEWEYSTPIAPVYLLRKLKNAGQNWEITPAVCRKAIWESMSDV